MADTNELLLPEVRLLWSRIRRAGERGELSSGAPAPGGLKADRVVFLLAFTLLLVLTVVLIVLSFPAGIYAVFSGHLSTAYTYNSGCVVSNLLVCNYFWVGPGIAVLPSGIPLGVWFALFAAVYASFFVLALKEHDGPRKAIASSVRSGVGSLLTSPFVVVIVSIGFFAFTTNLVTAATSATGAPIGGPQGDPLGLFVSLAYAPLVEELGFRVLLIGVVAVILSMGRPWRTALAALWRPSRAIEGLALGSGASIIIWAATGFSAATFGACHVVCGSTWDVAKLPEAIYGGVVLGYVYVRYGLHVAVLTHWGLDYLGYAFSFFGQAAYGIPWTAGLPGEYIGQYAVDIDLLFLFGLISFLLVLYLGAKKLARWRSGESSGEFDKGLLEGGGVEA